MMLALYYTQPSRLGTRTLDQKSGYHLKRRLFERVEKERTERGGGLEDRPTAE